jgi:phosphoribosylformimino-5-aminoimidazole carboxamide ribotide isomerase
MYENILKRMKLKLIASGGVSNLEEIPRLASIGCEGVIIGKAIYENRISLKDLESFILNQSNN